jgi:hypothetical protein
MDALLTGLGGPAMGAALVGLVWALATAIKRRAEGAAAQDEAGAKATVLVMAMVHDLRGDLDREQAARGALEQELRELRDDHEEEKSKRQHYESQYAIVVAELAMERKNSAALKVEMDGLRRDIMGKITIRPPRV